MKELFIKTLTDKKSRNKRSLDKIALTSITNNTMSWGSTAELD